jgi:hypothetical protein
MTAVAGLLSAALLAVILHTAGCTTGRPPEGDTAPPEPALAADVAHTPAGPSEQDPDPWWWLDAAPSPDAAVTVTGAHAETLDGFDRLVLDLAGQGEPGWGVESVESGADDGTGDPVEVAGTQLVRLRLAGVAFPADVELAALEPQLIDVGGPALTQVAVRSWSEGTLNVFLGVADATEPQIMVTMNHDPRRLTVDVAHP